MDAAVRLPLRIGHRFMRAHVAVAYRFMMMLAPAAVPTVMPALLDVLFWTTDCLETRTLKGVLNST